MAPAPEHRGPSGTSAVVSYALLLVGFFAIGVSTQMRDPISGLWITEAAAITLPALIALRGANVRLRPWLGLEGVSLGAVGAALGLAILNQPIIALLEWFAQQTAPAAWVQMFQQKNVMLDAIFRNNKEAMVATVIVAAPIGEEIFFRGFAQPALARRLGIGVAVVAQGALFAAIHLDPVGFIGLWELGIFFGLLRHATGSLWPSIIAHAANNAIAAAAFLAGLQKPEEVPPPWLLALGGVLLVAGVALAVQRARRPDPKPARAEPADPAQPSGDFRFGRTAALAVAWAAAVAGGVALYVKAVLPRVQ